MCMRLLKWSVFTALSMLVSASAFAADIAYKAPPAPAPIMYNWSGFYIGGNVGYGWANSDYVTSIARGTAFPFGEGALRDIGNQTGSRSFSDSGFTYGAQAGINIQTGNWVWGGEVDVSSIRLSNSALRSTPSLLANGISTRTFTFEDGFDVDWLVTGRGRLGWAANNWLFYGTGGVAFTSASSSFSFTDTFAAGGRGVATVNGNGIGWTAGGGIEYGYGSWSIKAEYLYVDFGTATASVTPSYAAGPGGGTFTHSADFSSQIVRLGLNYRFGGSYGKAPVVAKY